MDLGKIYYNHDWELIVAKPDMGKTFHKIRVEFLERLFRFNLLIAEIILN